MCDTRLHLYDSRIIYPYILCPAHSIELDLNAWRLERDRRRRERGEIGYSPSRNSGRDSWMGSSGDRGAGSSAAGEFVILYRSLLNIPGYEMWSFAPGNVYMMLRQWYYCSIFHILFVSTFLVCMCVCIFFFLCVIFVCVCFVLLCCLCVCCMFVCVCFVSVFLCVFFSLCGFVYVCVCLCVCVCFCVCVFCQCEYVFCPIIRTSFPARVSGWIVGLHAVRTWRWKLNTNVIKLGSLSYKN